MGIWLHCEPVLRAHCRVFTVRVGDRRLAAVKSFRWLAPQKHAKHTAGSRQLLCGTNALHWVLDAKADFHSARSQQDQEERSSLSFVQRLTNCDVKTDVFQKPVASHCATDRLVFPDSLHSACSHQWSQDPLEAACDYIMLWKWNEGEEWIWLDGDGWRWKGGLFCYLLLLLSFFHPFLYTIGSFLSFFNPPPSFKFDSGNVIHLYSVVSLFLSPLPLFLSAVRVEWLLRRWTCKGQSNYCVWTALLSSVVLSRHKTFSQSAACIVSAMLRQNMYHTHNTLLYRACIYWRPPKIYFEVIFFFSQSSDWDSWNS